MDENGHFQARLTLRGRVRPLAARVHATLVEQELLVARALDTLRPLPDSEAATVRDVTAVVKTFERPHVVQRLVTSARRLYPTLPIVVVDDSRKPVELDSAEVVPLPYDSGVSAGRAAGLARVRTEYVLVLDDDIVFFRGTRLAPALALMERHREIDVMGGQVIDLPRLRRRRLTDVGDAIFPTDAVPLAPLGSTIGGLTVCAKVWNFFLARRDRLALVEWDPQLKRMEHADFFTRALGTLVTVFNPDLRCLHARTPFDEAYIAKRLDLADDAALLARRYAGRA